MTVAEIIVARCSTVVINARVNSLITLSTEQTGSVFGTRTNDAIALLVLHWLALDARNGGGVGGAGGAITSETEGQLSRSYGGGMINNNNELASTSWGLELLRLRNTMIFSARNRTI